jgi:hypothetical protein
MYVNHTVDTVQLYNVFLSLYIYSIYICESIPSTTGFQSQFLPIYYMLFLFFFFFGQFCQNEIMRDRSQHRYRWALTHGSQSQSILNASCLAINTVEFQSLILSFVSWRLLRQDFLQCAAAGWLNGRYGWVPILNTYYYSATNYFGTARVVSTVLSYSWRSSMTACTILILLHGI